MTTSPQCNMIKQQLRTSNVTEENILNLFERLPREHFVPKHLAAFAYSDAHLSLEHHQQMMTPAEEGLILKALHLQGHEKVLEVGTGSGYLTALMSQSCNQVITFDIFQDLIEKAQDKLAAHQCHNVTFHTSNAYQGFPEQAPYDCIILGGGMPSLDEKLLLQLAPGGRLIAFTGTSTVQQAICYTLENKTLTKTFLFNTTLPFLVPLQVKHTFVF